MRTEEEIRTMLELKKRNLKQPHLPPQIRACECACKQILEWVLEENKE